MFDDVIYAPAPSDIFFLDSNVEVELEKPCAVDWYGVWREHVELVGCQSPVKRKSGMVNAYCIAVVRSGE